MLHHQPQILSPLPEMASQSSDGSSLRARKMSAAGNRSWSEEEENYLLQTRMQKMPYKHIAAHLKKTELACRLHYHQLSHGSHRRRRNSSVSSTASFGSIAQSVCSVGTDQEDFSQSSRHTSPMSYAGGAHHIRSTSLTASPGRSQHKILLPKPRTLTPQGSPEPHNGLRINTEVAYQPRVVDTDRLRAIYEARRQQFWSSVAADYGADVSPAQLEEIWRNSSSAVRPPTPDASPDGSMMHNQIPKSSAFHYPSPAHSELKHPSPLNISAVSTPERLPYMLPMPVPSSGRARAGTWSSAPRDNMPIASLLTEDKNPRQY
ncbi:hypothetical protein SVAN01_08877 [Stagonosporopsis vannaccii]|nr:hypothetical protein SVAN01_08877 [Stagonosporopsis vannaccii]